MKEYTSFYSYQSIVMNCFQSFMQFCYNNSPNTDNNYRNSSQNYKLPLSPGRISKSYAISLQITGPCTYSSTSPVTDKETNHLPLIIPPWSNHRVAWRSQKGEQNPFLCSRAAIIIWKGETIPFLSGVVYHTAERVTSVVKVVNKTLRRGSSQDPVKIGRVKGPGLVMRARKMDGRVCVKDLGISVAFTHFFGLFVHGFL